MTQPIREPGKRNLPVSNSDHARAKRDALAEVQVGIPLVRTFAILQLNCKKLRHNPKTMKAKPNPSELHGKAAFGPLPAHAPAEMRLREAAVRVTAARVKVLSALLDARCAYSHQDMQDRFIDIDRVTLYRALDCLTEAGLVHKIAGDDRVFRYSAGAEHGTNADPAQLPMQHQHGHFKCTRCTKVFCLDRDASLGGVADSSRRQAAIRRRLESALQETLGKGFQSHNIELTIKGWCADCAH